MENEGANSKTYKEESDNQPLEQQLNVWMLKTRDEITKLKVIGSKIEKK